MRPTLLPAAILAVLSSAPSMLAQAAPASVPSYRARLLGVFDGQTGEPVEGAEVIDVLTKTKALTTKTGTVSLAFLEDGGSMIRVQKIGFHPYATVVAISPVDTVPLTIVLEPIATTLPAVVTKGAATQWLSPGLRAFEERRRQGFGHFVTDSMLRKSNVNKMTNIVRTLPNLSLICPTRGVRVGECWAASARRGCTVDVYINGVPSVDNDLEKLRVDEFSGVEFYSGPATIPPEYNRTGSACGALLFWFRER